MNKFEKHPCVVDKFPDKLVDKCGFVLFNLLLIIEYFLFMFLLKKHFFLANRMSKNQTDSFIVKLAISGLTLHQEV